MTYYRLNEDLIYSDISDGMAILINIETGVYYGLNGLGTEVYSNLVNGVSSETVLKKLKSFTDNAEEQFEKFIEFLQVNEIMLPSKEGNESAEAERDEETAKECDYVLNADKYLDAQELLLADPIHEVKEAEGWAPEKSSLNEDKEDVARREAKMKK